LNDCEPRKKRTIASSILLLLVFSSITAGGVEKTAVGATVKGSADHQIPAYIGDRIKAPENWQPGDHYEDPFETDQVLFTITPDNLVLHESRLAPGQKALLTKLKGYALPVYQTRRTAGYPKFILDGTASNKANTMLSNGGNGLLHYSEGFPFPLLSEDPQRSALQAIWNHITRFRGGHVERTVLQATILQNGDYVPIRLYQRYSRAEHLSSAHDTERNNVLLYYLERVKSPARLSGSTLLVHETLDQSKGLRRAWGYNHAYRRVLRLPNAAYDTPMPGTYGLKTADSYDMFNGAPDKYSWKHLGVKEIYVPYNAYQLANKRLKYKDILSPSSVNPDHTRWELHRVHKIEARLREGERHIYAKRVFYLDEDSWTIVLAEQYDHRGELWRVSEGHLMNYYDKQLPYYAMEVTYDLIARRYNVIGLSNEESSAYTFNKIFSLRDFSPSSLRRDGRG